jgi:hypothetical protein
LDSARAKTPARRPGFFDFRFAHRAAPAETQSPAPALVPAVAGSFFAGVGSCVGAGRSSHSFSIAGLRATLSSVEVLCSLVRRPGLSVPVRVWFSISFLAAVPYSRRSDSLPPVPRSEFSLRAQCSLRDFWFGLLVLLGARRGFLVSRSGAIERVQAPALAFRAPASADFHRQGFLSPTRCSVR